MIKITELNQSDFKYTAGQQQAISALLAGTDTTQTGWLEYEWSERIVQRGTQIFGVFSFDAREVMNETSKCPKSGLPVEYMPVVIDGKMLIEFPDEGRVGVAHVVSRQMPDGSVKCVAGFIGCGWIRHSELDLPAAQIAENILREIDAQH